MSDHFDTMQVCRRWGHKITEYYDTSPNNREDFCKKCGGGTVHICDGCKTNIRGHHHFDGVIGGGGQMVPLNCHKCGARYPWKIQVLLKKALGSLIAPLKYIVDSVAGIFKK